MNTKIAHQINRGFHKKIIPAHSIITDYGHFARWQFGNTYGQVSPTKITQFNRDQKKFITVG